MEEGDGTMGYGGPEKRNPLRRKGEEGVWRPLELDPPTDGEDKLRGAPETFGCFDALRRLVYQRTGLFLGEQKRTPLHRHVRDRMRALDLDREERFVNYLRFFDPQGEEFQILINRVTVNETYFFRDFSQLQSFAEGCLPELATGCRKGGRQELRILSAGCATGEEPYTLAIILMEMLEEESLSFEIVAVDIDDGVLENARRGRYDRRAVKDVPKVYLDRYFDRVGESYLLRSEVKRRVRFLHGNLSDARDVERWGTGFDTIFCRNVLIYFDDEARQRAVERFFHLLRPGGYIFLGHAEPLSRISNNFRVRRSKGMVLYQKPHPGREKP